MWHLDKAKDRKHVLKRSETLQPRGSHCTQNNFQPCTSAPAPTPLFHSHFCNLLWTLLLVEMYQGTVCEISPILSIFGHYMHDEDIHTASKLHQVVKNK